MSRATLPTSRTSFFICVTHLTWAPCVWWQSRCARREEAQSKVTRRSCCMSLVLKDLPAVGTKRQMSQMRKGCGLFLGLFNSSLWRRTWTCIRIWGEWRRPGICWHLCLGSEWQFTPVKCVWGWECGPEALGSWQARTVNGAICAQRWMELRMRLILISWLLWLAASSHKRVPHPFSRGRSHTRTHIHT